MGSWGITAFESDIGLDAVDIIREHLRQDGILQLKSALELLKNDAMYCPDIERHTAHTGVMALAEIMLKFSNHDLVDFDCDDLAEEHHSFQNVRSFIADRESIAWMQHYLADSLRCCREYAKHKSERGSKGASSRCGWYTEEDWVGWQEHMQKLINSLSNLLDLPAEEMDLLLIRQSR